MMIQRKSVFWSKFNQNSKQWDLDSFLSELSVKVDKKILDIIKEEKLLFGTGELLLESNRKSKNLNVKIVFYFKDNDENWEEIITKAEYNKLCFQPEVIRMIEEKGSVKFPIESPSTE